jgi:hypothetical protein
MGELSVQLTWFPWIWHFGFRLAKEHPDWSETQVEDAASEFLDSITEVRLLFDCYSRSFSGVLTWLVTVSFPCIAKHWKSNLICDFWFFRSRRNWWNLPILVRIPFSLAFVSVASSISLLNHFLLVLEWHRSSWSAIPNCSGTFNDFNELAIQYGYVVMFAPGNWKNQTFYLVQGNFAFAVVCFCLSCSVIDLQYTRVHFDLIGRRCLSVFVLSNVLIVVPFFCCQPFR